MAQCFRLGASVVHPLTGRYMHGKVQWKKESEKGK
ncbi:lactoylglutathione lyase [Vibrio parahaemolyticus]|nr:lactoylglutathione lyase [Vibrio parahaemolyticus]